MWLEFLTEVEDNSLSPSNNSLGIFLQKKLQIFSKQRTTSYPLLTQKCLKSVSGITEYICGSEIEERRLAALKKIEFTALKGGF